MKVQAEAAGGSRIMALPFVIKINFPLLKAGEACADADADAEGVLDGKRGACIADILALVDHLCLLVMREIWEELKIFCM